MTKAKKRQRECIPPPLSEANNRSSDCRGLIESLVTRSTYAKTEGGPSRMSGKYGEGMPPLRHAPVLSP